MAFWTCECLQSGLQVACKWLASGLQVACKWLASGLQVACEWLRPACPSARPSVSGAVGPWGRGAVGPWGRGGAGVLVFTSSWSGQISTISTNTMN